MAFRSAARIVVQQSLFLVLVATNNWAGGSVAERRVSGALLFFPPRSLFFLGRDFWPPFLAPPPFSYAPALLVTFVGR